MTTRMLALSAVVTGVLLTSQGCAPPEDGPKSEGKSALVPETKKVVDLLVGVWDEVTFNGMPLPPGIVARVEFTADGRFIAHTQYPGNTGTVMHTYVLQGQTIHVTAGTDNLNVIRQNWRYYIVSISADELIISEPPGSDSQRDVVYHRVKRV